MTNLRSEDVPAAAVESGKIKLRAGAKTIEKFVLTFGQGAPGEPIALIGSSGFLEIAINKGNAARTLGVARGGEVNLELPAA